MDFDFENLIYIFGALAYFASAIFGWFKDKNKKKNIEDSVDDNKEIQEDKIPKTFQDLVEQVKSELDQNDNKEELVIEEEIIDEELPSIENVNSEFKENIEEKNINKETEKKSDKSSSKKVERLEGYKIIEESNEKFENELFEELKDSNSLKKAFLFKEILKRKF